MPIERYLLVILLNATYFSNVVVFKLAELGAVCDRKNNELLNI